VGRLVDPGTREGVPRARGTYELRCGEDRTVSGLQSNSDGQFRVPLSCGPLLDLTLDFSVPGGAASLELRQLLATSDHYVGDVYLERARDIVFRVRSADGAALPGAVAYALDSIAASWAVTDSEGLGVLLGIRQPAATVRFEALGHAHEDVELGPEWEMAETLDVVLSRLPAITLVVQHPDLRVPVGCSVAIQVADVQPFLSHDGRSATAVQESLGAQLPARRRWNSAAGEMTICYRVGPTGRVAVPGFMPRSPIAVRVHDLAGNVVTEQLVAQEACLEPEEIVLVVPQREYYCDLLVVDEDGVAIGGAMVEGLGASELRAISDGVGQVEIGPLYRDYIEVVVKKEKRAPSTVRLSLYEQGGVREVVLSEGHTLRVRVVDALGVARPFERLLARVDDRVVGRVVMVAGSTVAEVHDLRNEPATICVQVNGEWYEEQGVPGEELVIRAGP
jgi:hypothetical protein